MSVPLATNVLVPSATFFVELLVIGPMFALLVIWPLVETLLRRRWGYAIAVALLGPIGGLLWFLVGRRGSTERGRVGGDPSTRRATF